MLAGLEGVLETVSNMWWEKLLLRPALHCHCSSGEVNSAQNGRMAGRICPHSRIDTGGGGEGVSIIWSGTGWHHSRSDVWLRQILIEGQGQLAAAVIGHTDMVCTRVRPHFRFGSEIWNWRENFVSLRSEKKPDFTWFTSMRNTKNLKRKWRLNKRKLSEKIEAKQKLSEKSEKKRKKNEKIDLHFASLCFASKQKLLNQSEAKI